MQSEIFRSYHKVRSYECDLYGHVNNAVYLNYLEFARMEVLETKGLTLDLLKENGYLIVIRRVEIDYIAPLVATEEILIETYLKSYQKSSGVFDQKIYREKDKKLIARANVTWVTVDLQGRPVRIPALIQEAFGIDIKKV